MGTSERGRAELLRAIDEAVARTEDATRAVQNAVQMIDEGRADHPRVETSALISVARHQMQIALGNLQHARDVERPA